MPFHTKNPLQVRKAVRILYIGAAFLGLISGAMDLGQ
jgi:hypothetical protein